MSSFWSAWIIVLTVVTIVGVVWLLLATRKMKIDRTDNTTGHVYDGIVEEDNPLPAWWFNMFMISVVFGVGYLIFYPGMGSFSGVLGWSSAGQLEQETAAIEAKFAASTAEFSSLSLEELAGETQALAMGRRLYANNCSVCHGADARGSSGFPSLIDSSWQWGGSAEQIMHSILQGRQAAMPAWEGTLSVAQIDELVDYVDVLAEASGEHPGELSSSAKSGKQTYQTFCIACHGADGSGNALLGAPALNDDVWLYGGGKTEIYASIQHGRNGQMPAHNELLGESRVRLIVAYLLNLASTESALQ